MTVTFLIGNGFDLRMGMKTRYIDMYDSYIESASEDEDIALFKEVLKKDKPNKYTNWGDFESSMGRLAVTFKNEMQFIKCVRDFKNHLVAHLEDEESRFKEKLFSHEQCEVACANVIHDAITNFYRGQTPNVINKIFELKRQNRVCHFITFNYTSVFDFILIMYGRHTHNYFGDSPIHVHGKLGENVVLGVDNISQFGNLAYSVSKKMERAFVKPMFNEQYDTVRVGKAKRMIMDSDVICVYGMSLGITDEMWINEIKNWLLSDQNHHLVYFQYSDTKIESWKTDEKMDEEDDRKDELLNRLFDNDEERKQVYQNVHIPVGFDIFDIHKELEEQNEKQMQTMGSMIY